MGLGLGMQTESPSDNNPQRQPQRHLQRPILSRSEGSGLALMGKAGTTRLAVCPGLLQHRLVIVCNTCGHVSSGSTRDQHISPPKNEDVNSTKRQEKRCDPSIGLLRQPPNPIAFKHNLSEEHKRTPVLSRNPPSFTGRTILGWFGLSPCVSATRCLLSTSSVRPLTPSCLGVSKFCRWLWE